MVDRPLGRAPCAGTESRRHTGCVTQEAVTDAVLLVAEGVLVFSAGILLRRPPRDNIRSTPFSRIAIVSLLSLAILLPLLAGSEGEVARATPTSTPPARTSSQPTMVPGHAPRSAGGGASVSRSVLPENEASLSSRPGHLGSGRLVPVLVPPTVLP
jgi:hypothetical protein